MIAQLIGGDNKADDPHQRQKIQKVGPSLEAFLMTPGAYRFNNYCWANPNFIAARSLTLLCGQISGPFFVEEHATMGLHHLLGGSTCPGYSLLRFDLQEKDN